jgi:hypothetical protein
MAFFLPPPIYVDKLALSNPLTLSELCSLAQVSCKASGEWTQRLVEIVEGDELRIIAEPGPWGKVKIEAPSSKEVRRFAIALEALAYGLHDVVAREGIRGSNISPVRPRTGRPKKGSQRSNRQRQRDYRERKNGEKRL